MTRRELENFPKPCGFNNWSTAHTSFLKTAGLAHFTRHDLRRTYSTATAEWTLPHVLSRLLAHAEGGVLPIYNRYAYLAEMREAVLKWDEYLASL
jgi:integrase